MLWCVYVNVLFFCMCCELKRHPACCDCQGEQASIDGMGPNPCVFPCVFKALCLQVQLDQDQVFLLQRVLAPRGRDVLKDEVKYWCKSLIPIKHIDLTIVNGNCVCVCVKMFFLWFTTLWPKAQQALCWLITAQDLTRRAIEWHHHQSGLSPPSITTHPDPPTYPTLTRCFSASHGAHCEVL